MAAGRNVTTVASLIVVARARVIASRQTSGADRKGQFLLGTSTTSTDTTNSSTSTTGTTGTTPRREARHRLAGLRRHRGVALRAGAGAVVLLGVTAGIDSLAEGAAEAAPAPVVPAAAVTPDQAVAQARADQLQSDRWSLQDQAAKRAAEQAAQQAAAKAARAAAAKKAAADVAARKAAAEAAATKRAAVAAAAAQAAQTAQQRAAAEASRSSARDPRSAARAMLAARGWAGQFGCLDSLWQRESGWNYRAYNASSGAFGIPQALPGGKMAAAGSDWQTNPVTQIRWGLSYIASTYGTPCGAWGHSQAYGWY